MRSRWPKRLPRSWSSPNLIRYFLGLQGRYDFKLGFRVHKEGEDDYLTRSQPNIHMARSVNAEIDLEPGKYTVIIGIEAEFCPHESVERLKG